MDLREGVELAGRYRISRKLGEGGMGAVYVAERISDHLPCVIKTITGSWADNPKSKKRFAREAEAAALLDHPGIVKILELDAEGNEPFIAMEYLEGRTLSEVIKEPGPMPVPRAVAIVTELLDALRAAHARGIVHRDLKPANIMLVPDADGSETLKVLDFGIARIFDEVRRTRLTQTGQVVGTPGYLAPEQAMGNPVDARTDLFAVGVILYVMLAEQLPFRGKDTSQRLIAMLTEAPAPLARERPDVPEQVVAVIHRALEKDPNDRYASAMALARALEDALAGRPDVARPERDVPRAPTRPHAIPSDTTEHVPATALPGTADQAPLPATAPPGTAGPVPAPVTAPPDTAGAVGTSTTSATTAPRPKPSRRRVGLYALGAIGFFALASLATIGVLFAASNEEDGERGAVAGTAVTAPSGSVSPLAVTPAQTPTGPPMAPSTGADPGEGSAAAEQTEPADDGTPTGRSARPAAPSGREAAPEPSPGAPVPGQQREPPPPPDEATPEPPPDEAIPEPPPRGAAPTVWAHETTPTPRPEASARSTRGRLLREGNPVFLREIERGAARDWVRAQLGDLTPCFRTMAVDREQGYTIRVAFRRGQVWNPHSNSDYLSESVKRCIRDVLDDRGGFEHGSFGFRVRWVPAD